MFRKQILFVSSLLAMIAIQDSMAEAKSTKFSLPDGTQGLYVTAPNAAGDVAGFYFTPGHQFSHSHGFIRLADGTFTTIDVEESNRRQTRVAAIDDDGDVVGQYERRTKIRIVDRAFVRTPDGTLTSFDAPGAYDTMPFDVNARAGEVVGWYYTDDGNHGFVRTLNGALTTIDYPGADGTYPYAVNAQGQITGTYFDSDGVLHGFLRQPSGSIKTIDPPNSLYTDNVVLNDKGQVSGIYQDSGSGSHYGFLRDHGTFYTFDQYFSRLNAHNQAVGETFLLTFRHQEFETTPVNPAKGCFNLFLSGINDGGLISGSIQCGQGRWFGYLTDK